MNVLLRILIWCFLFNSFLFGQGFRISEIDQMISATLSSRQSLEGTWLTNFGQPNGVRGTVFAMATDSLGNIYVGGDFIWAENVLANHIVKWDGHQWLSLGTGVTGGYVYAIAVKGTDVFVGGSFTRAGDIKINSVAKWNGTNWSALGSGMDDGGYVYAMHASKNGKIYAGGQFGWIGNLWVNNLAEWDGLQWKSVGISPEVGLTGIVRDLDSRDDTIYVGGNFSRAGNITVHGLTKWDGTQWAFLNNPVGNNVSSIAVDAVNVYVAGIRGGVGLATENGPVMIQTGLDLQTYSIQSLAIAENGDLYVCGFFVAFNGDTMNSISRWDGNQWNSLTSGGYSGLFNLGGGAGNIGIGFALVTKGNEVYAAGTFWAAGDKDASNVAMWNGTQWNALSSGHANGVNGFVQSIDVSETGKCYVGGTFELVGNLKTRNIACWDGTKWDSLQSGVNNGVRNIAVRNDTDVYIVGDFTEAGGIPATRLARWNGKKWQGIHFNGTLVAVAVDNVGNVYIGGTFSMYSYGYYSFNVAKWDGVRFVPLGTGLNSPVNALAVSDDGVLYAGAGTPSGGIQKWDGNNWQLLGGGANGIVYAVSTKGSNVYIGGYFSHAGTTPANGVAKWNGTSWEAFGTGVFYDGTTPSQAMAISADDYGNVYVGGWFKRAGGLLVNYIGRWDGTYWQSLSTGMDKEVAAVTTKNSLVYFGGSFTQAGYVPSTGFAIWDSGITPVKGSPNAPHEYVLFPNYPNPFNPSTTISYSLEHRSRVRLEIFDVLGRKLVNVVDEVQQPGNHTVDVNMSSFASGVYLYRLNSENRYLTRKMVLMK